VDEGQQEEPTEQPLQQTEPTEQPVQQTEPESELQQKEEPEQQQKADQEPEEQQEEPVEQPEEEPDSNSASTSSSNSFIVDFRSKGLDLENSSSSAAVDLSQTTDNISHIVYYAHPCICFDITDSSESKMNAEQLKEGYEMLSPN